MSPHEMTECVVEEAALRWLEGLRHEIQLCRVRYFAPFLGPRGRSPRFAFLISWPPDPNLLLS
jgi:hypothetical protein